MYHALIFLVLMVTWTVFSGQLDLFHLGVGVISAALVTWISGDMLFEDRSRSLGHRLREALRIPGYLFWLLGEVVKSNLHVFYLALHPRSRELLEPRLIRFKTKLKTDYAKFVFANSITLTPGTVTISVEGDEFFVHAISRQTADSLPGEMERRVALAFEKEVAG